MKKTMMIAGAAVGLIVVVVVVGLGLLVSNLDGLVKAAVEKYGSQATGTAVSLAEVKISLTEGKGTLKGLVVGNPKGFTSNSAFRLGEISVAIDTGSVTKNPVVIKEVLVAAPEVTYEIGADGSNIDAIQKNLEKLTGGGGKAAPEAQKPAEAKSDEPKLIIDLVQMKAGKMNLVADKMIPGMATSATLPDIRLTGIGRKSNGASGAEVAQQVIDSLTKAALSSVSKLGIDSLVEGGQQKLMDAAGSAVPGGVPAGAGDALKGLMGK